MGIVNPGTLIIAAMLVGHPVGIVAHLTMGGLIRRSIGSHHGIMAPAIEIIALVESHRLGIKALQAGGCQVQGLVPGGLSQAAIFPDQGVFRR